MRFKKISGFALSASCASLLSAVLVACGGGGGSSSTTTSAGTVTPPPSTSVVTPPVVVVDVSQSLSGVAATGAAMDGAIITITDSKGASVTKTAGIDGSFSADVTSMTAPFVITASKQVGDSILTLTSVAVDKPAAGTTGTANVTPLTDALAALIAPNGHPSELQTQAVLIASATKSKVDASSAALTAAIANVLADAGLDPTKFNIITTPFTANRTGADRVLEMVKVESTGQGVSLVNTSVPDNGLGSASVQISSATTAANAPKVPAPPAGTVLGEQDHFAALAQACFADAPAVRAPTVDAGGTPTSLSPACAAVPFASNYKSGGFTSRQRYAGLLTNSDYTGAKFSKPERVFTTPAGTVFFKMAFKTLAGSGSVVTDVAQKTSPAGKSYTWEIVGNQRDYDSAVDVRLDNSNQLNPAAVQQESGKSQFGVSLRLFFNPINSAGLNAQAVRVKGPGLPAAGVSMHRSNLCGPDTYMTITYKTGSLVNPAGAAVLYNTSTSNNFKLSAALKTGTIDWTKVTNFSNWRDAPLPDADIAAIPSFAEYTWEVWTFGGTNGTRVFRALTNATPADITYTQRLPAKLPAVSSLKTLPWNTIDTAEYLNPTGTLTGAQSSASVSWKSLVEPVDYVNVTGNKFVAASSSFVRVSSDTGNSVIKISETSKTVAVVNDTAGTSSLLGLTGVALPLIPNCAATPLPAFDGVQGTKDAAGNATATSRSLTIRSRDANLTRKYVSNSWNNFID